MKLFGRSRDKAQESPVVPDKYAEAENHIIAGEWQALGDWAKKYLEAEPEDMIAEFLYIGSEVITLGYYKAQQQLLPKFQERARSEKEYELAFKTLYKWLEDLKKRSPKSAGVYFLLGVAYFLLDRPRDGISATKQAVKLKPDFFEALVELASAYGDQGKARESIEWAKKALAIRPDSAEAHLIIGHAYISQRAYAEAIKELRKCVKLDPQLADAWNDMAVIKVESNRPSEAVSYAQKAVEINPNHKLALTNLGSALANLGKVKEAVSAYEKVLAIDPDDMLALHNLAFTLEESGNYSRALQYYKKLQNFAGKLPADFRRALEQKIAQLEKKKP